MKDLILKLIKSCHERTGGHNGISIIQLRQDTKATTKEIEAAINELYKEKKVIIRKTLNDPKMIFLKV